MAINITQVTTYTWVTTLAVILHEVVPYITPVDSSNRCNIGSLLIMRETNDVEHLNNKQRSSDNRIRKMFMVRVSFVLLLSPCFPRLLSPSLRRGRYFFLSFDLPFCSKLSHFCIHTQMLKFYTLIKLSSVAHITSIKITKNILPHPHPMSCCQVCISGFVFVQGLGHP